MSNPKFHFHVRPLAGFVFTAIAAVAMQAQAAPDRAVAAPTVAAPNSEVAATMGEPKGAMKNAANGSMKLGKGDRMFVTHAAEVGHAEVEAAQVALDRSTDPDVKNFAKHMFDDHGKANSELLTLSHDMNVEVPTGPDAKQNLALKKITEAKPDNFDKVYMQNFGASAHHQAIALFEKESKSGKNPELKEFATKTLPTLKEHLAMTKTVKVGMKTGGAAQSKTAAAAQ